MVTENLSLWDVLQEGRQRLSTIAEPSASLFESYCLMEYVFGYNKTQVLLHQKEPADPQKAETFFQLVQKRQGGYPLQYLIGSWEFWGYTFSVGEGVLIPRADTETLADCCLQAAEKFEHPAMADLCSGSGCLPVVFSKEVPHASSVYAVELSDDALYYLRKNVEQNHCSNIQILQQDVLTWKAPEPLHIISCNPPYLTHDEMAELQTEVTYEPAMALEAPENGLLFYRVLSHRCMEFLVPGGMLAFEVGYQQADAVRALMEQSGYANIRVIADLCGINRVVCGEKPKL